MQVSLSGYDILISLFGFICIQERFNSQVAMAHFLFNLRNATMVYISHELRRRSEIFALKFSLE